MRFYNIEVKGKMMLEKRTTNPTGPFTLEDRGRLYYKDGYVHVITDAGRGCSFIEPLLIYDSFTTDFKYGQLTCPNSWCENQTYNVQCHSPTAIDVWHCTCLPGDTMGVHRNVKVYTDGAAIAGYSNCNSAIKGCSTYRTGGLFISVNCFGSYSCSTLSDAARMYSQSGYGVCAYSDFNHAVVGNTPYCYISSRYLKHTEDVCLSNCIRKTPISVYKYYWEDSNTKGFNQSIGPLAEDFDETFNVINNINKENYDGLWSVEGVAFGLALENLKEIDKLKEIIVEMYSCIKKLENKEI